MVLKIFMQRVRALLVLAFIFVFFLSLPMLAGCGGKSKPKPMPPAEPPPMEEPAEPTPEVGTVPYLFNCPYDLEVAEKLELELGIVCQFKADSRPGQASVYKCDAPGYYLPQSIAPVGTWQNCPTLGTSVLNLHMRMCGAYGGYRVDTYNMKEIMHFEAYSTEEQVLRMCVPVGDL